MKTILIAGGAGFIGTNLTKRPINDGHKFICVDNFFTCNRKNVETIKSNNRTLIQQDI